MPLFIGQTLHDRYQIEALLGQGGMGAVYRATDNRLNIPVAIKENLDASPVAQSQFTREAQIAARLSHPDLPRVTDYFFIPGQGQYLVMDYIEGEDLEAMVSRMGPLPEQYVLPWIIQVCEALEYLHQQNPPVIHRDIKPANIKIRPNGKAVLVDFGIAKVYDPNLATTLGAKAVTPGYSPVEQYGGKPTDTRSDIYALGATLYRLLTGSVLPESVQFISGDIRLVPPRQLNPSISINTEQAILKAIELATNRRFQSASEFRAALSGQRPVQVVQPTQRMPAQATMPAMNENPSIGIPRQYSSPQSVADPQQYSNPQPAAVPQYYPTAQTIQQPDRRKKLFAIGVAGVGLLGLACIGLIFLAFSFGNNKNKTATKTAISKTEVAIQRTQDSRYLAATQQAQQLFDTQQAQADQATRQVLDAQSTQAALQSTRQAPGYIASIQGWFTDLNFYESANEIIPIDQRVYSNTFDHKTARYIFWQIGFDREQAGQVVNFTIDWTIYNPDGSVMGQASSDTGFEADWADMWTTDGWGFDNPGNWPPGNYRAEFYIDQQKITEGTFTIK